MKKYRYIIDNLRNEHIKPITNGLKVINTIKSISVYPEENYIEILAKKNPEKHVESLCEFLYLSIRTKY